MRRTTIGLIVSVTFSLLAALCLTQAQQVVFLVRHREQANGSDDPPLPAQGLRASGGGHA
jgi:hypothetical protein